LADKAEILNWISEKREEQAEWEEKLHDARSFVGTCESILKSLDDELLDLEAELEQLES